MPEWATHLAIVEPSNYDIFINNIVNKNIVNKLETNSAANEGTSMTSGSEWLLPNEVRPLNYDLKLAPDLESFTFEGSQTISVEVKRPTKRIELNCVEIEIHSAEVSDNDTGGWQTADVSYDEDRETATLSLQDDLNAGMAEIRMRFSGELNDKLRGFYRSSYTDTEGSQRWMATTQFEATDARRAFPCWDEPAAKATFDVTLTVPQTLVVVSNTEPVSTTHNADDTTTVRFAQTPVMSTYLLAFIVGDLACVQDRTADGVLMRVWATRGNEEKGRFALETSMALLDYFHDYFGVPYPLSKLDHIAIPDFAAGAMENWGAITYREVALLVDPENSSASTREVVSAIISHEMAHQWFGDLVTMEWWDDLWLNESFASWMGDKAVDYLHPEWEMWTQFLTNDTTSALSLDGLRNSHPIEQAVNDPAEIGQLFDAISYSKGGSILRMLEHYLGADTFREGLRIYIKRHQYANARTRDLWNALAEASGQPVTDIMQTWTAQTGYPTLDASVERGDDGGDNGDNGIVISLSQSRFLYDDILGADAPDDTRWSVPITARTASDAEPVRALMTTEASSLNLTPASYGSADEWIKVNPGQSGFYRVKYPDDELERLKTPIRSLTLPAQDRLGLQSDTYALAKAGHIPVTTFLNLAEAYSNETDPSVAGDLSAALNSLSNLLSDEPFFAAYQAFGRGIFKPIGERVGWDARDGEGHRNSLLRSRALAQLGHFEDDETLSEARRRFDGYLEDPASLTADLRAAAFTMSAKRGGADLYDAIWELEKTATLQEEKMRFLAALCSFEDRSLLQQTLDRSLDEAHVRSQDTIRVMVYVASNRHGRDLAWGFLKDNWDEFDRRYGEGGFAIMRLVEIASLFTTEEKRQEVRDFFDSHPVPSAERTIRQGQERMAINIAWLAQNREDLARWLVG